MANNLTGAASLAYQGTNAASPPNITTHYNRPTANFYQGFSIGDLWVFRPKPPTNNNELWVLMGVVGNVANWVLLSNSAGVVLGLTGNTGGQVLPLAGNINVVGDGTTISVAGNPGTHTLTISAMGTGTIETLTANSGGPVSPLAGNINVVGDGTTITIAGNPGTHTLTATAGGTVATSYVENSGTAAPSGGVLNVLGTGGCTTSGAGNTITINAGAPGGIFWNLITAASAGMAVNNGYIADRGTLVTLTLPAVAAFGTVIRVAGYGAGGWLIAQNAGQFINYGVLTSTTGVTGSLASTQQFDSVEMVCIIANTTWDVISGIGNITVV